MEEVEMEWYSVMREFPQLRLFWVSIFSLSLWVHLDYSPASELSHSFPPLNITTFPFWHYLAWEFWLNKCFITWSIMLFRCSCSMSTNLIWNGLYSTNHPLVTVLDFYADLKYILIKFLQISWSQVGDCTYADK